MSVDFAHESERNVAAILDYYDIEWQYEPTTFVLACHADGSVSSAFSPDFYLPAFDLYVEITTMAQKHVTKKNRKLRQLRERYPDVEAKILYQRDYERLMLTHLSLIADLADAA